MLSLLYECSYKLTVSYYSRSGILKFIFDTYFICDPRFHLFLEVKVSLRTYLLNVSINKNFFIIKV